MDTLEDVLVYFAKNYPHKDELSNARMTKMVYLADWLSALRRRERLTDINWFYDNYGPFVWDVKNTVDQSEYLTIHETTNFFGAAKKEIKLIKDKAEDCVSENVKKILDHVIKTTKSLRWNEFIKLVYSTYPVASSSKYSNLDLLKLASEYKPTE